MCAASKIVAESAYAICASAHTVSVRCQGERSITELSQWRRTPMRHRSRTGACSRRRGRAIPSAEVRTFNPEWSTQLSVLRAALAEDCPTQCLRETASFRRWPITIVCFRASWRRGRWLGFGPCGPAQARTKEIGYGNSNLAFGQVALTGPSRAKGNGRWWPLPSTRP